MMHCQLPIFGRLYFVIAQDFLTYSTRPSEQFTDEAAAERADANHEGDADDDLHPGADPIGKNVLQSDHRQSAQHRPHERAHAAEQGHQNHLT